MHTSDLRIRKTGTQKRPCHISKYSGDPRADSGWQLRRANGGRGSTVTSPWDVVCIISRSLLVGVEAHRHAEGCSALNGMQIIM